ncbi:MAG: hypothetical protein FH749_13275 [Firmicutes bacterium]|nr:hypothetical protein [Bacillota bacterium]
MTIEKSFPVGKGPIPPPTEVACVYVKKIYDACSQRECDEFFFTDLELPEGVPVADLEVECSIVPGSEFFEDWSIEPIDGGPLGLVRVNVCAILEIRIFDTNDPGNYTINEETVCFFKEVILYAPDPIQMQVLVESIFEALACEAFIETGDEEEEDFLLVIATIGAFIIVKTALHVQLLVPAFGFCPVPPECEELGDLCEQFLQRPFPPFFPPQLNDLNT